MREYIKWWRKNFANAAPEIWNELPVVWPASTPPVFKSCLKTHFDLIQFENCSYGLCVLCEYININMKIWLKLQQSYWFIKKSGAIVKYFVLGSFIYNNSWSFIKWFIFGMNKKPQVVINWS